jgi:hypothetical protein
VANFSPASVIAEMLTTMDVFKIQRVLFGHPLLADDADKGGVSGLLHRLRHAPTQAYDAPPRTPSLRDRLTRKIQWDDDEPAACRAQQNDWYAWCTNVEWARYWEMYAPQWRRPLEQAERQLTALTDRLLKLASDDH